MMKVFYRVILGGLLIGCLGMYTFLFHPQTFGWAAIAIFYPEKIYEMVVEKFEKKRARVCPDGIEEAIAEAGIKPNISLSCRRGMFRYKALKDKGLDIVYVVHKRTQKEGFYIDSPVNISGNPALMHEGKFYILPESYDHRFELKDYVREQLKTPASFKERDWGERLNIDQHSDIYITIEDDYPCFNYRFKHLFVGEVKDCPKKSAIKDPKWEDTAIITGSLSYAAGIFEWGDAIKKLPEECAKYEGALCKHTIGEYAKNIHKNSSYMLRTYWKPSSGLKPGIESYMFMVRTYNHGKEEQIFAEVFADGAVQSKKVERRMYSFNEVLELSEGLKSGGRYKD